MYTNRPFYTPLGNIRPNGDFFIQYRIKHNVQWVSKNHGKSDEQWYSQKVGNRGLKESPLSERESAMEEQSLFDEQRKQFFSEINRPLVNVNRVDFSKSAAFAIGVHQYGITTARSRMPILGSFAAGPCVICALYDIKNKIAGLAHIYSK